MKKEERKILAAALAFCFLVSQSIFIPRIAFASGTYLVIASTGDPGVIFQDYKTLTGSGVNLGATTRTLSKGKTLTLVFDGDQGIWKELSYGNNQ